MYSIDSKAVAKDFVDFFAHHFLAPPLHAAGLHDDDAVAIIALVFFGEVKQRESYADEQHLFIISDEPVEMLRQRIKIVQEKTACAVARLLII